MVLHKEETRNVSSGKILTTECDPIVETNSGASEKQGILAGSSDARGTTANYEQSKSGSNSNGSWRHHEKLAPNKTAIDSSESGIVGEENDLHEKECRKGEIPAAVCNEVKDESNDVTSAEEFMDSSRDKAATDDLKAVRKEDNTIDDNEKAKETKEDKQISVHTDCLANDLHSCADDETSFVADDGLDDNDEQIDDKNAKIPNHPVDQGYAWVVLLASFALQFLLLGYLKTMGIFFVEFQSKFGSSSSMTSLVVGLGEAVASLGAFLVMGFLLKYLSPRMLCMIGSFSLSVGVVGNSQITDIKYMCITHGICFGIGMATLFSNALYVLTQYFEKRRALATSISTCGTSLGGMVFPLLARRLLDEYTFQGGVLMVAGVLVHACVFSALLTPIDSYPKKKPLHTPSDKPDMPEKNSPRRWNAFEKLECCFRRRNTSNENNNSEAQSDESHKICKSRVLNINEGSKRAKPTETFSSRLEICEEGVPLKFEQNMVVGNNSNLKCIPISNGDGAFLESVSDSKDMDAGHNMVLHVVEVKEINSPVEKSSKKDQISTMHVQDGHLAPVLLKTHQHGRQNGSVSSDQISAVDEESLLPVSVEMSELRPALVQHQLSQLSRSTASIFCSTSTLHTNFADIMSINQDNFASKRLGKSKTFLQRFCISCKQSSLIRSMTFWNMAIFFFTASIGQAVPHMYIPALAKEKGLSEDEAAFFISVMNILDFPSRIAAGLIVNYGFMRPSKICILPMFTLGVVGYLTPFYNSYESFFSMVIIYGLFNGIYFAMQSLVVIEMLGIENFASAIGFYYLSMGFGSAISYPICGALRDTTGTYSATYHYLATGELVALASLLVMQLSRNRDLKRGVLKDLAEEN